MTDRPIPFSGPMVRALIEGRKTQTRRVLKPQPVENVAGLWVWPPDWAKGIKRYGLAVQTDEAGLVQTLMYDPARRVGYATGDRLYVREAWRTWVHLNDIKPSLIVAQNEAQPVIEYIETPLQGHARHLGRKRPGMFMPRWASRMTLTVTDVRVHRLNEISEADAIEEGIMKFGDGVFDYHEHAEIRFKTAKGAFKELWNNINGPDAWDADPWVVALTFDVQHCNIDEAKP